jgi:hypothetical protein
MFTEDELKEAVHPLVMHVLKEERKKRPSLREAQEAVARKLDGSARWLRRLIGRCPNAALHGHQMLNLVQLYLERNGDRKPIRSLWKRVLKSRPKLAQIRSAFGARILSAENSTVA